MGSEAAREKLDKELDIYLDASLFMSKFQRSEVISVAWDSMIAVMRDLKQIMVDKQQNDDDGDDVSLIISEHRLKVENQLLQYISDNHVSYYHKKAFQEILANFKSLIQQQADLNAADATGTSKNNGIVSQLTKLELQQQKYDEEKLNVCVDKQDEVTEYIRDYQKTLQFMERFVHTKLAPEIETVLRDAFRNISKGYRRLHNIYRYSEVDKWYDLDVSQLIKGYKSKVETELKEICIKVSDPTIKEAFSCHLNEVIAQNHHPHLHCKDEKRMSSKQKMSVIQKKKKKKSSYVLTAPGLSDLISVKYRPSCRESKHHHSQYCFKTNYNFERMPAHLMKSPPKAEE